MVVPVQAAQRQCVCLPALRPVRPLLRQVARGSHSGSKSSAVLVVLHVFVSVVRFSFPPAGLGPPEVLIIELLDIDS